MIKQSNKNHGYTFEETTFLDFEHVLLFTKGSREIRRDWPLVLENHFFSLVCHLVVSRQIFPCRLTLRTRISETERLRQRPSLMVFSLSKTGLLLDSLFFFKKNISLCSHIIIILCFKSETVKKQDHSARTPFLNDILWLLRGFWFQVPLSSSYSFWSRKSSSCLMIMMHAFMHLLSSWLLSSSN